MGSRILNDKYQKFYVEFFNWSPPVFTYILTSTEHSYIKIGSSKTPEFRLASLQTGTPFRLKIVWCWPVDVERELHHVFAIRRVLGEWFDMPVDEAIRTAAMITKMKCKES